MDVVGMMGYVQFWGLSPALNLLQEAPPRPHYTLLLSGTCDIRHLLKTLADMPGEGQVTVYFHQTQKELLCRALLFLHVLHETDFSEQELADLFLDLYGNALLRERSLAYLNATAPHLRHFVHEDLDKSRTRLGEFCSLAELKFEERDELGEVLGSWFKGVQFDMVKHRNQRLRHIYGERYDYRLNMYDWDFNFHTKQMAPIVHWYHYRTFRQTGVAFEARYSKYVHPNLTLASFLPGRKKTDRTSCLVRGYWGDMTVTPYVAMGIHCDYEPDRALLFKIANQKYCGHSVQVTEFNFFYWVIKLRTGQTYHKRFTDYYRLSLEDRQQRDKLKETEKARKDKLEQVQQSKEEEKDEEKEQEQKKEVKQTEDQQLKPQSEATKAQSQATQTQCQSKAQIKTEASQLQPPKEQAQAKSQKVKEENKENTSLQKANAEQKETAAQPPTTEADDDGDDKEITTEGKLLSERQQLLQGFRKHKLRFIPTAQKIETIIRKKAGQFDVLALGFPHSKYLTLPGLKGLLKEDGVAFIEKADFVPFPRRDDKKQAGQKLQSAIEGAGFKVAGEVAFNYRCL